jgi:hypothetical protein
MSECGYVTIKLYLQNMWPVQLVNPCCRKNIKMAMSKYFEDKVYLPSWLDRGKSHIDNHHATTLYTY